MVGFPIAWEETQSIDQISDLSPYSTSEIEDYLCGCFYHLVLEEKPTTFQVIGLCFQKRYDDRIYWLFEARDRAKQRRWFVVVGTGKSPFELGRMMKRWMYGETIEEDVSPEEFLDQQYRDQLAADAQR